MFKKLMTIFCSALGVSVLGIALCSVLMLMPVKSQGQATDWWKDKQGSYQITHSIVGDDSVTSSMVSNYFSEPITAKFEESNVTLYVSINLDKETESTLKIFINDVYKDMEKIYDDSSNSVTIFKITTSIDSLTDTITFKMKAGAMPFEPEFSLLLALETAITI